MPQVNESQCEETWEACGASVYFISSLNSLNYVKHSQVKTSFVHNCTKCTHEFEEYEHTCCVQDH